MTKDRAPPPESEPEEPVVEQQILIPRPPSPEEQKEIGRQQALITDEWSGEEPGRP